jgi:hypothetical protein
LRFFRRPDENIVEPISHGSRQGALYPRVAQRALPLHTPSQADLGIYDDAMVSMKGHLVEMGFEACHQLRGGSHMDDRFRIVLHSLEKASC